MRYPLIAIALACVALGGCAPAITMPPGFVAVENNQLGPYEQRAVSADGVVVALRKEANPKGATLDFWATAVRDELVTRRGYHLATEESVESISGTPGRLVTCTARRSGAEFTYLAAVYVEGSQVLVVEAGGKADALASKLPEVRKALTSIRAASF